MSEQRHYTIDAGRSAVCGADDPRLTSFLESVDCAECLKLSGSPDPEIANLERAVVEAAVNFHRDFAWSGQFVNADAIKAHNSFYAAVSALIAAREKVEKPITYSREDIYFDHD